VQSQGKCQFLADLQTSVKDETVLLVDDLVDTGLTLATAYDHLRAKGPARVITCVLLEKEGVARHPSAAALEVDYVGRTIPNLFVVGMCNDYSEHFRNYPDVVAMVKDRRHVLGAENNLQVDYEELIIQQPVAVVQVAEPMPHSPPPSPPTTSAARKIARFDNGPLHTRRASNKAVPKSFSLSDLSSMLTMSLQ